MNLRSVVPIEGIGLIILLVVLIQGAAELGLLRPGTFPSPVEVASAAWVEVASGSLWKNLLASLEKYAVGYLVGTTLGVLLGIWIGISRFFDEITQVVLHVGRQIPGLAWIPLAILWFGIGDGTSIFVIILSSFFPTVIFTLSGVRSIDRVLQRAALTLGARRTSLFMLRTVIVPGAIPQITVGLRVAVASAWTSIVAAEMVGSVSGVGYLIQFYRTQYRIDRVVFYMIVIAVLGYLFDYLIRNAQARLLVWQSGTKAR